MTSIYFVRHAQSIHSWEDDRTRPVSAEGFSDAKNVTKLLETLPINCFYSIPYKRSTDTISESADVFKMPIHFDERFRERRKGMNGNNHISVNPFAILKADDYKRFAQTYFNAYVCPNLIITGFWLRAVILIDKHQG